MCISAVLSAAGAFMQAGAQRSAAFFQAGVERNNQITADRERAAALVRGRAEGVRKRQALGQVQGAQFVAAAASGIDPTAAGSFQDVLSDTALHGELDAGITEYNASLEARGFEIQAANFGTQAELTLAEARSINPGLSAATALIGGLGSFLGGGGGGGTGLFGGSTTAPTAFGALGPPGGGGPFAQPPVLR